MGQQSGDDPTRLHNKGEAPLTMSQQREGTLNQAKHRGPSLLAPSDTKGIFDDTRKGKGTDKRTKKRTEKRTEDREEDREEDIGQRKEDRGQRTEDRGQRTEKRTTLIFL